MPELEEAAETHDLVIDGEGVMHVEEASMQDWQRDYYIMDLYKTGYVFVPTNRRHMHPGFRLQHSFDPSHQLCQTRSGPPAFVSLRPVASRGELTFNYGPSVLERLYDATSGTQTSTTESDMDFSMSLSGSPHAVVGKGGTHTTRTLYERLERRVLLLRGEDERADLAFDI